MPQFKNKLTLILVVGSDVVRADFAMGKTPRLKHLSRAVRSDLQTLPVAVELALSDGGRPAATVLLTDELWSGIVDVDSRGADGLTGDELEQMLKFEAETFSDVDPMTSYLGQGMISSERNSGRRRFQVAQVDANAVAPCVAAVAMRRGRLTHVMSPLGLVEPNNATEWLEFSAINVAAFRRDQGGSDAAIVPRTASADRWWTQLGNQFGGELPQVGWIWPGAEQVPAEFAADAKLVTDDAQLEQWLLGAAARLAHEAEAAPLISVPAPETTHSTRRRIGNLATVAALVLCACHFTTSRWVQSSMESEIEQLQAPATEKADMDSQKSMLTTEIDEQKKELEKIAKQHETLARLNDAPDRFAILLSRIAEGGDENLLVEGITPNEKGIEISGRVIRSDSASRLASHLTVTAAQLGWKVEAPELDGKNQLINGGPWKFTIELTEVPRVESETNGLTSKDDRDAAEGQGS